MVSFWFLPIITEGCIKLFLEFDCQTLKAAEAKKPDKTKMEYILAAIICVLVVAFCITLYIMLNNIRRLVLMLICMALWFYWI